MADTTSLKNRIRAAIKSNDNQEITGPVLQQILLDIVDELDLYPELQNETNARSTADSQLQNNINSEANARQNADTALQQGINSEASTRESADTQLQNNINSEANARQNADTALQQGINAIHTLIDNGFVYAGIATPSTSPATGKVFYIAVQAGTYTNFSNTTITQGINILKYNGSIWSKDVIVSIDDTVTLGSKNVIESNAVAEQVTFLSSPINSIKSENYRRIIGGYYVMNTSTYARYKGVSFPKMSAGDKLIFNLTGSDSVNNAFDIGEFTFNSGQYSPSTEQQSLTSITGTVAGNQISYTMQNNANVVICLSRDLTVTLTKVEKTVKEAISDIESEVNGISGNISTIQGDVTNIKNTLNSADDTVEYGSEDLVKSGAVAKELVLSSLPINSIKSENYKRIIDGYYVSNPSTYARYQGVSFAKMSAGDKLVFNLTGEDTTNTNYDIGEFIFNSGQYSPTANQQALAYVSGVINGSSVSYIMQNDANVVICLSRQFTVTLQKQTGTIKEKVIELGSRMDTAESEISSLMPTQPYITEAEEATKDAQAYPTDLKLAVFSDPHTWNRITYQVLNEINKLGTIDFVAGLGDFQPYDTTAVKAESMLSLAKMMSVSGRNLGLYVVGNHDIVPNSSYVNNGTYSAQTALSKNEVFDCFDRHLNKVAVFDEDNPYGGYYYVDFSASKVRVIVLNTSDIWNSAGTITKHYKQAMTIQQAQVDWFMNKALDFSDIQNKEDWGVLVLSHNLINTENLSAVIIPILVAFKNGEAINTSVTLNTAYGSEEKDVISIVHDFTQQGSMDVIGSLEGHTHVYREYPTNTPTIGARQVREITFNADNKAFNQQYQKEFDSLPAGEYYIVASGVTLVFTLSDSYNDVILKYKGYGISTTRQAGCSINDVDSGVVLYEFTAIEGTPSAGATELTGFVTDQPDGTAETETCYIVGVDRSNRILHIVPYGHGTEKTVNY